MLFSTASLFRSKVRLVLNAANSLTHQLNDLFLECFAFQFLRPDAKLHFVINRASLCGSVRYFVNRHISLSTASLTIVPTWPTTHPAYHFSESTNLVCDSAPWHRVRHRSNEFLELEPA